jgi:ammonia channel protein AmtB
LLFSWTAASIVSGSVIERIRSTAFWVHAVLIGSVFWIIDAAWGWHYGGWIVRAQFKAESRELEAVSAVHDKDKIKSAIDRY